MAYLLDANVFISATRQWYGFDFCPGFWDWLDLEHERGNVRSIERVRTEIDVGADQLVEWARERPAFFEPTSTEVLVHLRILSAWASSGYYEQSAVTEFLQSADYYLIAHAMADGHVVVTHEVPSPSTKRIKIPDAAIPHDVKYLNTFEMLRTEHARFELYA